MSVLCDKPIHGINEARERSHLIAKKREVCVAIQGEIDYTPGDFEKLFWSSFKPAKVADTILDPRQSFRGHKDMLLVSLIGWMVKPQNPNFRRMLTTSAVARRIESAEEWALKQPGSNNIRDFNARHVRLGQDFISEVYYAVGGIEAVSSALSRDRLQADLKSLGRQIRNVVEIARIYHIASKSADPKVRVSQRKIRCIFDIVWGHHQSIFVERKLTPYQDRKLFDVWRDYTASAGYLYAASQTLTTEGQVFLDDLLEGNLYLNAGAQWVGTWLARSAYASCMIAKALNNANSLRLTAARPTLRSEELPPPSVPSVYENVITSRFQ